MIPGCCFRTVPVYADVCNQLLGPSECTRCNLPKAASALPAAPGERLCFGADWTGAVVESTAPCFFAVPNLSAAFLACSRERSIYAAPCRRIHVSGG